MRKNLYPALLFIIFGGASSLGFGMETDLSPFEEIPTEIKWRIGSYVSPSDVESLVKACTIFKKEFTPYYKEIASQGPMEFQELKNSGASNPHWIFKNPHGLFNYFGKPHYGMMVTLNAPTIRSGDHYMDPPGKTRKNFLRIDHHFIEVTPEISEKALRSLTAKKQMNPLALHLKSSIFIKEKNDDMDIMEYMDTVGYVQLAHRLEEEKITNLGDFFAGKPQRKLTIDLSKFKIEFQELFLYLLSYQNRSPDLTLLKGGDINPTFFSTFIESLGRVERQEHYSLRIIDLSDFKIDGEKAREIAKALQKNKTIRQVILSDNAIGNNGASSLAEALQSSAIEGLELTNNTIGAEGAGAIAETLKKEGLKELLLDKNFIGEQGSSSLAEALKKNESLTVLSIADNDIGNKGADAIAKALRKNSSLKEVFLDGNNIGPQGALSLAEALRINKSLTRLNMNKNSIGDEGASKFAVALKENTSLERITLRNNDIGNEGVLALAQLLMDNRFIKIEIEEQGIPLENLLYFNLIKEAKA